MTDRLTEILLEDLPILCDLYRPDGKKSYVAYMTICNYISWFRKDSNLKHVKFYCLNDDYSDGTFVVIVSTLNKLCFNEIIRICSNHFSGSLSGIYRHI